LGITSLKDMKQNGTTKQLCHQTEIHRLIRRNALIMLNSSPTPRLFEDSMAETIFDKILARQIPAQIVFEDQHVIAFKDISPQARVHVLVVPKKKARNLSELQQWQASEVGLFFQKVAEVADLLGLKETGYRTVLNTGEQGGQSVDYIHAHILGGEALSGRFA
jgi:histidine triad (HIT) family protein